MIVTKSSNDWILKETIATKQKQGDKTAWAHNDLEDSEEMVVRQWAHGASPLEAMHTPNCHCPGLTSVLRL